MAHIIMAEILTAERLNTHTHTHTVFPRVKFWIHIDTSSFTVLAHELKMCVCVCVSAASVLGCAVLPWQWV